ncbi:hypothetical protein EVAR_10161_1 [Eumeta japonica]|uniref:Uncharacterized protein n=1 Tax=Eumeta variegata TaxID=151549 RepID=A0A4C1TDA4_EUMVA|nr:hypothetical protein EVAR_10161_1 [Eumeta japonica]
MAQDCHILGLSVRFGSREGREGLAPWRTLRPYRARKGFRRSEREGEPGIDHVLRMLHKTSALGNQSADELDLSRWFLTAERTSLSHEPPAGTAVQSAASVSAAAPPQTDRDKMYDRLEKRTCEYLYMEIIFYFQIGYQIHNVLMNPIRPEINYPFSPSNMIEGHQGRTGPEGPVWHYDLKGSLQAWHKAGVPSLYASCEILAKYGEAPERLAISGIPNELWQGGLQEMSVFPFKRPATHK